MIPEQLPQGFKKVKSSNLHAVAFFPKPKESKEEQAVGTLEVIFGNGTRFRYANVPADTYHAMIKAESIGRFFIQEVRNKSYAQEMVPQPWPDVLL